LENKTKANIKRQIKITRIVQVLYGSDFTVFLLHHQCQKSVPSAGSIAPDLKKYLKQKKKLKNSKLKIKLFFF
jgi:hypothetical protein